MRSEGTLVLAPAFEQLRPQLLQGCRTLGLTQVSDHQLTQLLAYLQQLDRWGKVFNLTAVRDPAQMISLHLLDCLALVASLQKRFADQPLRILDVGSGAGLPAIVLAIMSAKNKWGQTPLNTDPSPPEIKWGQTPIYSIYFWEVHSVDSVEKKVAFQRQVRGALGLDNLVPVHGRIQDIVAGPFDLITCRAFAELNDFYVQSVRLLSPRGMYCAMKGQQLTGETQRLEACDPPPVISEIEQLSVPSLNNVQRHLVWFAPIRSNQ